MVAIVERLTGVLTLVALAVAVVGLVVLVRGRVPRWLSDVALPLATAIAVTATVGSLFMSEVAGYPPCELCWYQRIAMYPLVVVLGIAAWRRDPQVWRTAVPIAAIGTLFSAWHVAIERRPALGGMCDPAAPCSLRWVEEFGILTLPMMAGIGFLAIIVLSLVGRNTPAPTPDEDEMTDAADPLGSTRPE